MSAADIFLKLDTVPGESQDDKHKNELEIQSYSWGATNAGSAEFGGGNSTGKANFQDFHFTVPLGKAADLLFLRCISGEHIPTATLTQRKAGKTPQDALQIVFNKVMLTNVQLGNSSGAGLGSMQVGFTFESYKMQAFEQCADGTTKKCGNTGWDQKKGIKL